MTHPAAPKLDGFEFLEYLGGGTFGHVWKVRDTKMEVFRAIKVLHRNLLGRAHAQHLLVEAQTMARLRPHRNRVQVHYFKEGVVNTFLVMDYVAGGALSRLTLPGRPLPWGRAARWIASVADALLDVHSRSILHRDIKPNNILWEPETDEAVLGDFGLAVAVDLAGRGGGTRGYTAPEASRGAASPKSDVYSLAATLLHLVTGEHPARHNAPEEHAHWASVPEELRQVIQAGLESDPTRRADLPTFLARLREARWKALTDRMLAAVPDTPCPVKLQATVAVASADRPAVFRPLLRDGRPVPAATGDFVKVEARATADGNLTVLVLESSGELQVALPCPTEPRNGFRAGQVCSLIFRLAPPAGTERILIHWSAKGVQRTLPEWRQWVERAGLALEDDDTNDRPMPLRGVELYRVTMGPAPGGHSRTLVIPVPHVPSAGSASDALQEHE
jgi:serine/threonine protein kinase